MSEKITLETLTGALIDVNRHGGLPQRVKYKLLYDGDEIRIVMSANPRSGIHHQDQVATCENFEKACDILRGIAAALDMIYYHLQGQAGYGLEEIWSKEITTPEETK